uniref:ELM2 and Myb/SANT-like domain containing 1 n=1 Tax=Iconisemion striatum TaxID=60296 RepID=A0A1A7X0R5_9TELE
MPVMSVPAQQKVSNKRTGKRITFFNDQSGDSMKEASQHPDGTYYIPSGTASDPGQSEAASTVTSNPEAPHMYLNSVIFSPDKGDQSRGHYQQTVPMKWAHQEPSQQQPSLSQQQRAASWTMPNWGPAFASYPRAQNTFVKSVQETSGLQPANREAAKSQALEWEQQQQQQTQVFQETLKPGVLNTQQHSASHPGGSSVLQSFQLAFGQPKQHLPAYYQNFQGNRTTLPNPPNYSAPNAKPSHHLQPLQNPEQIQRQQQHPVIQQQIQHHSIIQHQHVDLQQQQQLHHEQQQQKMHQQRQQLQIQPQMQHQQLQQQNPRVLNCYPGGQNAHPHPQAVVVLSQESSAPAPPKIQEPIIQDITPEPQQSSDPLQAPMQSEAVSQPQTHLRRSRRLSKEGGAPSDNPFLPVSSDQTEIGMHGSENGARDVQTAPTGVIQSTRRKRRVSQEVNLEMLAQEALERKSPLHGKEPHRPWSPTEPDVMKRPRDDNFLPLVIPVSVPVQRQEPSSPVRDDTVLASTWPRRPPNAPDLGHADHKPSVIVNRRRSLKNFSSESLEQNDGERDDDGKKFKRRPRPEPLFIPPPKPSSFIAPPVYSSITPYQSHLRSPVRLADNAVMVPPYTPPPILSPVREGSGLYFSTFLSSAAGSGPGLPPPATPKSATRSLLRSNSCDITPPVLSAMSETTPVSIEPRINIGSRYQAEVPELRQRSAVQSDHHPAELVFAPLKEELKPDFHRKMEDLMHLACSSVLCGGGTNQELACHCLHQCKGDILAALSLLMLRDHIFPRSHHLSNYHYSGSDSWTPAERRRFNKGMAAYKKDFFMVQKEVTTKTVAQCVEFYYTYKKHVKIGRSGTLIYGETEPLESRAAEEELDHKGSQRPVLKQEEDSWDFEGSADRKQDACPIRVTHTLPSTENTILIMKSHEDVGREQPLSRVIHQAPPPPASSKSRFDGNARRTSPSTGNKTSVAQEGEFPCKKCGRIFYKVKSRSAHMKSHSEQEKKAKALRQKEAEELAAAKAAAAILAARQHNGTRQPGSDSTNDDYLNGEDEEDEDWRH